MYQGATDSDGLAVEIVFFNSFVARGVVIQLHPFRVVEIFIKLIIH